MRLVGVVALVSLAACVKRNPDFTALSADDGSSTAAGTSSALTGTSFDSGAATGLSQGTGTATSLPTGTTAVLTGGGPASTVAASSSSGADTEAPNACNTSPSVPGGAACPCDECVGTTCRILCDPLSCANQMVNCPGGWHCEVICDSSVTPGACQGANVRCPNVGDCNVQCTGDLACGDTVVDCGDGRCGIDCTLGDDACSDTELICGPRDAQITCAGITGTGPFATPLPGSMCECAVDPACPL